MRVEHITDPAQVESRARTVALAGFSELAEKIRSGKVRCLAMVATADRSELERRRIENFAVAFWADKQKAES